MKRTEIERRERELRRARKREESLARNEAGGEMPSVGDYINELHDLFIFDETKIWNVAHDEVLEMLMQIEADYPDKVETILKKAIRKTKVRARDDAFTELSAILTD
jgi:hypothetical protein